MSRVLKAEEAANYLGVHVETIRRLARSGAIPAMKVGRGWRFREGALLHWAETNHLRAQPAHVLAIDDEKFVLTAIRRLLAREGYRISTATQGEPALEIIAADPPDVVLLDLKMPGMDGPAILKRIRELDRDLPVIIITGYPDGELMMEAMRSSPIMVIPKPFETDQLIKGIELAIHGSRSKAVLVKRQ